MSKIWANSADSHVMEPEDLFLKRMPAKLAERMPRSEKFEGYEIVHVDGQQIRRSMPRPVPDGEFAGKDIFELSNRPPGAFDVRLRMADLDEEGIWGELTFPSLGIWASEIKDPELVREGAKALNDWALEDVQGVSPRLVATATLPLLEVADAVAEARRCAENGFHAIFLPCRPPQGRPRWNDDQWEPLWALAEEAGLVLAYHIGTDGGEMRLYRGPGGAILNYVETTYGGQKAASQLIAAGVLDRYPGLKVLIAEAGAAWVPYLGDRMNEAYRQHGMFVRPTLSMLPSEYLMRQVYASFQHDVTAVPTLTGFGYRNVVFGSDYPHLEGTYGHTQKTLHEIFDGVADDVRHRITIGAFLDLFPHVGEPPLA